jgi:hypothetical protein
VEGLKFKVNLGKRLSRPISTNKQRMMELGGNVPVITARQQALSRRRPQWEVSP